MKSWFYFSLLLLLIPVCSGCNKEEVPSTDWERYDVPVFRDFYSDDKMQTAGEGHIFYYDSLRYMAYTGKSDGIHDIKLAFGQTWIDWDTAGTLLSTNGASGKDIEKGTPYYRLTNDSTHQIYYIGYPYSETYEAEIYLAEAENLRGPYTHVSGPLISRGLIEGKWIHCLTSPSVVAHDSLLYMVFVGWNSIPSKTSVVWTFGATSDDGGHTWKNYQEVDCPLGVSGKITKGPDDKFHAVGTSYHDDGYKIYYAHADHPFGPWTKDTLAILTQAGKPFETDEIMASQIAFDPIYGIYGPRRLYYTGVNREKGKWMMMATERWP